MKSATALTLSFMISVCAAGPEAIVSSDKANIAYEKGVAHLSGKDKIPLDLALARKELEEAAAMGHAKAAVQLGILWSKGDGGPKDDQKAFEYFSMAAATGQREGLYNKGLFLLQGRGAPKDLEAAISCLQSAATAGSVPAHVKLADLFYFGTDGLSVDRAKALPHVKAAADAGDAWACNILGIMAERGYAMPRDRSAALHWFTIAANKGNAKAQGNLGRMLRLGKSTEEERLKSYVWLKLSSLQGDSLASYHLSHQRLAMTPDQIAQGDREVQKFNELLALQKNKSAVDAPENVR